MTRIPTLLVLFVALLLVGGVAVAGQGPGPLPPVDCPDADGDGICNGQDPDYVPGDECPDATCPNPDCPDTDGDGICNGQDPDYTPTQRDRIRDRLGSLVFRVMSVFGYRW